MSVYNSNLFENVIIKNVEFENLKIITGYASATFLKKVIEELPQLNIEIYIGMSQQGISTENHSEFCDIMSNCKNINIYYQYIGINNHMKLFEFKNNSGSKVFIGSANFTENGFIKNQEILGEVNLDPTSMFLRQKELSIMCTHPDVDTLIDFYIEENEEQEVDQIIKGKNIIEGENENNIYKKSKKSSYIPTFKKLRNNPNTHYFNKFDIEVVLDEKANPTWSEKGINAWVNNKSPHIQSTLRVVFEKYFPTDEIFEVYTDDGFKFKCRISGKFNSELQFINENIYEYIKNRINLNQNRPISRNDLTEYGKTKFHFIKVEKNIYLLDFASEK
nr:restriction endonuclease PLD domain-containing protein [Mammaliicoccus sp. Marseille-Q6498]